MDRISRTRSRLHTTLTQKMIRRRPADSQKYTTPDSQNQILYILCIHVNENAWIDRMRRIKKLDPMLIFEGDPVNSGPTL